MTEGQCALYARVSSESQARDNTIASQVAALRERIAAENFQLEPDHSYVDEGYSGSILSRPALERLRDAVAGGHVERIYVHAPDRLARRYAHQVLLIDGCGGCFLKPPDRRHRGGPPYGTFGTLTHFSGCLQGRYDPAWGTQGAMI